MATRRRFPPTLGPAGLAMCVAFSSIASQRKFVFPFCFVFSSFFSVFKVNKIISATALIIGRIVPLIKAGFEKKRPQSAANNYLFGFFYLFIRWFHIPHSTCQCVSELQTIIYWFYLILILIVFWFDLFGNIAKLLVLVLILVQVLLQCWIITECVGI